MIFLTRLPIVSQQITEIQPVTVEQSWRLLAALARSPWTVCSIVAASPVRVENGQAWGLLVQVLIVQEDGWYLVRDALPNSLQELVEGLRGSGRPAFFAAGKVRPLSADSMEDAARHLIGVPPKVMSEGTLQQFYNLFTPSLGETVRFVEPMPQPAALSR